MDAVDAPSQSRESQAAIVLKRPELGGRDSPSWADATGVVRARLDTLAGTPVVCIVAELDRHALHPCREALDQALGRSPAGVVVDLGATHEATPITLAFLGCMRRYLHARGGELILASPPAGLRQAMDHEHVLPLYLLEATTTQAVAALHAHAAHPPTAASYALAGTEDGDRTPHGPARGPRCCVGCLGCSQTARMHAQTRE